MIKVSLPVVVSLILLVIKYPAPSLTTLSVELESSPESGMFLQLPDESRRELEDSLDSDEDDIDDDTTSSQVNSNYGRDASKTTKPTNQRGGGNLNRDPTRYFAILQAKRPVTVRAAFGPISVRETIYPPSTTDSDVPGHEERRPFLPKLNGTNIRPTNGMPTDGLVLAPGATDLLSAHLVTKEVSRTSPVLRVLFYGGHAHATNSPSSSKTPPVVDLNIDTSDSLCAVVAVERDGDKLYGSCSPSNSREGACIAEVTLPSSWWPPIELYEQLSKRRKPSAAKVDYIVVRGSPAACGDLSPGTDQLVRSLAGLPRPLPSGAVTYLGDLALISTAASFEEVTNDDIVRILIPQEPASPRSKLYIPVCFRYNPNYPLAAFSVRVRAKVGLRVLGAQLAPNSLWQISVEVSPKQNQATVTAYIRDEELQQDEPISIGERLVASGSREVFNWLFEVDENAVEFADSGRVVWQVLYTTELGFEKNLSPNPTSGHFERTADSSKLTSRFNVQKDEVQAVIGVTKRSQMLNTAVISGRQVAQPLRIFVVSQSGRVGDVTLQANCHSQDESIIKVSPSCTSVYLDGSEIRGSTNASILIKYGSYSGVASFLVWMPKLPLDVKVSDVKLSQIKGWKTPHVKRRTMGHGHGHGHQADEGHFRPKVHQPRDIVNEVVDGGSADIGCRLRYQQTSVEVYTRFFSSDHDSGRESSLLSRRVAFQVTHLALPFLRVTDPRVALLRANVLEGLAPGRTEVQVISPITGRVIGASEIKVAADKEAITQLEVNLVAGLRLDLKPADASGTVWSARAAFTDKLVSQYQEGLLDVRVHFSDGTVTSLVDITDGDYHLGVDIFESGAVAYAPSPGLPYPRIIALGQGSGQLLHVSLEVPSQCQKKRTQQLAMSYVTVNVDFSATAAPTTSVQNDAYFLRKYNGVVKTKNGSQIGLTRPLKPARDAAAKKRKQELEGSKFEGSVLAKAKPSSLTPLEVGMYALLAVFSLAVFIFVASCMIFAVRLRGKGHEREPSAVVTTVRMPPERPPHGIQGPSLSGQHPSAAAAKDWVWLGRATLERNPVVQANGGQRSSLTDFNGNPVTVDRCVLQQNKKATPTLTVTTMARNGLSTSSGNRSSSVSYPGSEISIRITQNPADGLDVADDAFDSNTSTVATTRDLGPLSSSQASSSVHQNAANVLVTAGRTGRYQLLVDESLQQSCSSATSDSEGGRNVAAPPVPARRHKTTNSTYTRPPPVPPHRTAQANCSRTSSRPRPAPPVPTKLLVAVPISIDGEDDGQKVTAPIKPKPIVSGPAEPVRVEVKPPPIPAHGSKTSKPSASSKAPPVPVHKGHNGQRSKTAARPKSLCSRGGISLLGNASTDTDGQPNKVLTASEEWEEITKGMNTNQLLEYFGNLKESSA